MMRIDVNDSVTVNVDRKTHGEILEVSRKLWNDIVEFSLSEVYKDILDDYLFRANRHYKCGNCDNDVLGVDTQSRYCPYCGSKII